MSTQLILLPITPDAVGAAVDTTSLRAKKNILVTGLKGTILIEASEDGAEWCQVASFAGSTQDQIVTVCAAQMRVNASSGSADEVQVISERGLIRAGSLPAAPGSGPGASFDSSEFGCLTTVVVGGYSGKGSINIEVSGDGIEWSTAWSFNSNGCETKDVSAKFIRANGNGATASISIGSEDPSIAGVLANPLCLLYRPGATGDDAPGFPVFTDFAELYESFLVAREVCNVEIQMDPVFSSVLSPDGLPACQIPARPDPDNPGQYLSWDLAGSVISDYIGSDPDKCEIVFEDECIVTSSSGNLSFHGYDSLVLSHDGEVNSPIQMAGEINFTGQFCRVYSTNVNAKPLVESQGFLIIEATARPSFMGNDGGTVRNGFDCVAPLFDGGTGLIITAFHGATYCDNLVSGTGVWQMLLSETGPLGPFRYTRPSHSGFVWANSRTNKRGGHYYTLAYDDPRVGQSRAMPTPHTADYSAFHNDVVPVNSTGGSFDVTAPTALIAMGETFSVKDTTGACGDNPVNVLALAGETIEDGVIDTAFGCKTWLCDGTGIWRLVNEANAEAIDEPPDTVASGAMSLRSLLTKMTTSGPQAYSLADGLHEGQRKVIRCTATDNVGTLTPATFADGTTAAFDAVDEALELAWYAASGWNIVLNIGGVVIA